MPLVYLLVGYWLPALIVRKPNLRFEQRLLNVDRRLFGPDGLARFERRAPRAVIEYLELAYLLCYAVVPAGYVCPLLAGHDAVTIDRFWSWCCWRRSSVTDCCRGYRRARPGPSSRARDAARSSIRQHESGCVESGERAVEYVPERSHGGVTRDGARGRGVTCRSPVLCSGMSRRQHRRRQRRRPLSLRGRRHRGRCGGGGRVRYGIRRARSCDRRALCRHFDALRRDQPCRTRVHDLILVLQLGRRATAGDRTAPSASGDRRGVRP